MLVSIQISTGRVIEMQSHATKGTLITNAVNSGYLPNDVLEIETENYKVGYVWNGSNFVEPLSIAELNEMQRRIERDELLSQTVDRINPVCWASMTIEQQTQWITYRQELLDISKQSGFPFNVQWPTKPESA